MNNLYQEPTYHPNPWSSKTGTKRKKTIKSEKKFIYAKIIVKNKE